MARAPKTAPPPLPIEAEEPLEYRIDERALIRHLDPDVPISPDGLRSCTMLAAQAAYDRHVTREVFVDMLDAVADMFSLLQLAEQGMLISGKVEPAQPRIFNNIKHVRLKMIRRLELMAQCPRPGDKIS